MYAGELVSPLADNLIALPIWLVALPQGVKLVLLPLPTFHHLAERMSESQFVEAHAGFLARAQLAADQFVVAHAEHPDIDDPEDHEHEDEHGHHHFGHREGLNLARAARAGWP